MDFELLASDCERLIRSGAITEARARLALVSAKRVPRPLRARLANLCRRVDLLTNGLQLLSPVVQSKRGKWGREATAHELSEYAVLLQKSGAVREALSILSQIDKRLVPEAFLYQAYCHFNRWEYEDAVPLLRHYCAIEDRPYQRAIGEVNLASALVAVREESALEQVNLCLETATASGMHRLRANCLELRAQLHLQRDDTARARLDLEEAAQLAAGNVALDQLLIRKWRAVFEAREMNDVGPLVRFRELAVERAQWESVRETDRLLLRLQFSTARFDHLRFGSPFIRYQQTLETEFPQAERKAYLLYGESKALLDLSHDQILGTGLKAPRNSFALLATLASDFYKPFSLSGLFSELFADEHYDPWSSPQRVRQTIYRTRGWLEESGLKLSIDEQDGRYRLVLGSGAGVLLSLFAEAPTESSSRLLQLRQRFGTKAFSPADARAALDLSASTIKTLIQRATGKGEVERLRSGRATLYRFRAAPAA